MRKKLLAIGLAIMLAVTMIPCSVLAQDEAESSPSDVAVQTVEKKDISEPAKTPEKKAAQTEKLKKGKKIKCPSKNTPKVKAVLCVHTGGGVEKHNYESIAQAWSDANNPGKYLKKHVEIILQEDWIADKNKNFDFDVEGRRYGFGNGRLWPEKREQHLPLILNLNGHIMDRHMGAEDRDYGNLISVEKPCTLKVKNGTLTGGHNDKDGGCIYYSNKDIQSKVLYLENLTIKGNKSDEYGGGVYYEGRSIGVVQITDCVIENNETDEYGGGVYLAAQDLSLKEHPSLVKLTGKTIIKNNREKYHFFGKRYRENNLACRSIMLYPDLKDGSYIGVSPKTKVEVTDLLTEWVKDTADNRKQVKHFHSISRNIKLR